MHLKSDKRLIDEKNINLFLEYSSIQQQLTYPHDFFR